MNKIFILIMLFSIFLFASPKKYTIAVCATSTLEYALTCKKKIYENMNGEVFIVKENNRYFTNLNVYEDKNLAKNIIKNASKYVLLQKPYVKEIGDNIVKLIDKKRLVINLDEIKEKSKIKEKSLFPIVSLIPDDLEPVGFIPYEEDEKIKEEIFHQRERESLSEELKDELLQASIKEFDEQERKISSKNYETLKKQNQNLDTKNINTYDELIIRVDSKKNIMKVFAKVKDKEKLLKTYVVSTGKKNIKKPLGEGRISQISLNPTWYPTADTKKSFAKKGIILPDVVPPNHRYNYMGLAKLNLTHKVDGKNTYRIHGTLNEKTIGRNESAGCIRMKNLEVLELAKFVEKFASQNGLAKVKVILI